MAKILIILVILIVIGLLGWGSFSYFSQKNRISSLQSKNFNMKITSSAFEDNQMIPAKYTCDGEGVNPPLTISGAPAGAQSLVLIVNDPDSPSGTFKHWIIFNIAPETAEIKENSVPEGAVQLKNDFGNANYGGPCPGTGTHRYFFKIYALDQKMDLPSDSKLQDLEEKMNGHILDSAELIGLYKKK